MLYSFLLVGISTCGQLSTVMDSVVILFIDLTKEKILFFLFSIIYSSVKGLFSNVKVTRSNLFLEIDVAFFFFFF